MKLIIEKLEKGKFQIMIVEDEHILMTFGSIDQPITDVEFE